MADVFLLYFPSPSSVFSPPRIHQTVKQPTLSSVASLFSAIFPIVPCSPPTSQDPPPPLHPPSLPVEEEGRSSLGLRLQGQYPLAFSTLLLVGRPVPLLALGAAVACNLAATTDVELSKLKKDMKQDYYIYLIRIAHRSSDESLGCECKWRPMEDFLLDLNPS